MEFITLLGILLIACALILPFWYLTTDGQFKKSALTLGVVGVFAGCVLILNERITEITINSVGTIKASAKQAQLDAKAITDLKRRIESQSATVDLVAQEATRAKELSEEVADKNRKAEERLATLDERIGEATSALEQLKLISIFMNTVMAAQTLVSRTFCKRASRPMLLGRLWLT